MELPLGTLAATLLAMVVVVLLLVVITVAATFLAGCVAGMTMDAAGYAAAAEVGPAEAMMISSIPII